MKNHTKYLILLAFMLTTTRFASASYSYEDEREYKSKREILEERHQEFLRNCTLEGYRHPNDDECTKAESSAWYEQEFYFSTEVIKNESDLQKLRKISLPVVGLFKALLKLNFNTTTGKVSPQLEKDLWKTFLLLVEKN